MEKGTGKKPRRIKKCVMAVLFVFFGAIFAFSLYQLFAAGQVYQVGSKTYDDLAQEVVVKKQTKTPQPSPLSTPESVLPEADAQPKEPLLEVDFEMLQSINSHTVAWISSENEEINYPVVQGEDNSYYLNHLFDGTENKNGTIFMDRRNLPTFEDRNTLIYGHNMGNHTMFASLTKYGSEGYYEENPVLILVTPEESYYLQVFSGYVTKADSEAYRRDLEDDGIYLEFLKRIRENSDFDAPVEVTAEDRIVTLSTCSYVYDNARYVLHCKLVPA